MNHNPKYMNLHFMITCSGDFFYIEGEQNLKDVGILYGFISYYSGREPALSSYMFAPNSNNTIIGVYNE